MSSSETITAPAPDRRIEHPESRFGIRRTRGTVEITDFETQKPLLPLNGWVGDAVFKMMSIQDDFLHTAPAHHDRQHIPGDRTYTVATATNSRDTSSEADLARHMFESFCHKTAQRLLPRAFSLLYPHHGRTVSLDEFVRDLASMTYPVLVQISDDKYGGRYDPEKVHSFVILGTPDGASEPIICFEKLGNRLPYRLMELKAIWRYWERANNSRNGKLRVIAASE